MTRPARPPPVVPPSAPTTLLEAGVRVQALPWPVVDLLAVTLRKLTHDLTNSLVAAVSLADLTLMRSTEPAARDGLTRLRTQILRPRTTLQCATAPLPGLSADRPRTLQALATWVADAATAQTLSLSWQLQGDRLPAALTEAEWVHVIQTLCQNALEAHAAARIDPDLALEAEQGWLGVEVRPGPEAMLALTVWDNGPGCADLAAAASGRTRRAGGGHLGLGLAIAAALVDRAGGGLYVRTGQPRGWTATVLVPSGG